MLDRPAHSIVLLSYNAADLLPQTMLALAELDGPKPEIIVVENASTDGSRRLAAEACERHGWRFHPVDENIGYARGMNLGMSMSTGDAVIPLNCDAVLESSFLIEATRALEEFLDAGALAPRVSRAMTWGEAGQDDGSVIRLRPGMRVGIEQDVARGALVFKPNGAAPVFRRTALEQLGTWPEVFDPAFDTYGEDVDLGIRLWAYGWAVRYVPSMKALHRRSRGKGDRMWMKSGRHRRNLFRGRWYNALIHSPLPYLLRDLPLIAAQDLSVAVLRMAAGDAKVLADVGAAWRDVVRHRTSLRTRRRAKSGRLEPRLYRRLTRFPETN